MFVIVTIRYQETNLSCFWIGCDYKLSWKIGVHSSFNFSDISFSNYCPNWSKGFISYRFLVLRLFLPWEAIELNLFWILGFNLNRDTSKQKSIKINLRDSKEKNSKEKFFLKYAIIINLLLLSYCHEIRLTTFPLQLI